MLSKLYKLDCQILIPNPLRNPIFGPCRVPVGEQLFFNVHLTRHDETAGVHRLLLLVISLMKPSSLR